VLYDRSFLLHCLIIEGPRILEIVCIKCASCFSDVYFMTETKVLFLIVLQIFYSSIAVVVLTTITYM